MLDKLRNFFRKETPRRPEKEQSLHERAKEKFFLLSQAYKQSGVDGQKPSAVYQRDFDLTKMMDGTTFRMSFHRKGDSELYTNYQWYVLLFEKDTRSMNDIPHVFVPIHFIAPGVNTTNDGEYFVISTVNDNFSVIEVPIVHPYFQIKDGVASLPPYTLSENKNLGEQYEAEEIAVITGGLRDRSAEKARPSSVGSSSAFARAPVRDPV